MPRTEKKTKAHSLSIYCNLKRIIKKEDVLILRKMIKELESEERAEPFLLPVDYKGLGLLDYPIIIKHPMDLHTVKKKIKNFSYKYLSDIFSDFQLIWDNCMKYNLEDSDIYNFAKYMESKTNKLIDEYFNTKIKEEKYTKSKLYNSETSKEKTIKNSHSDKNPKKRKLSDSLKEDESTADNYSTTQEKFLDRFDLDLRYNNLNHIGQQELVRIAIIECPDAVIETEENFIIKSEQMNQKAVDTINLLFQKKDFLKNNP